MHCIYKNVSLLLYVYFFYYYVVVNMWTIALHWGLQCWQHYYTTDHIKYQTNETLNIF